jgi:hypothetical protein
MGPFQIVYQKPSLDSKERLVLAPKVRCFLFAIVFAIVLICGGNERLAFFSFLKVSKASLWTLCACFETRGLN